MNPGVLSQAAEAVAMPLKDFVDYFKSMRDANTQARIDEKFPVPQDDRNKECDALINVLNEQFEQTQRKLRSIK